MFFCLCELMVCLGRCKLYGGVLQHLMYCGFSWSIEGTSSWKHSIVLGIVQKCWTEIGKAWLITCTHACMNTYFAMCLFTYSSYLLIHLSIIRGYIVVIMMCIYIYIDTRIDIYIYIYIYVYTHVMAFESFHSTGQLFFGGFLFRWCAIDTLR